MDESGEGSKKPPTNPKTPAIDEPLPTPSRGPESILKVAIGQATSTPITPNRRSNRTSTSVFHTSLRGPENVSSIGRDIVAGRTPITPTSTTPFKTPKAPCYSTTKRNVCKTPIAATTTSTIGQRADLGAVPMYHDEYDFENEVLESGSIAGDQNEEEDDDDDTSQQDDFGGSDVSDEDSMLDSDAEVPDDAESDEDDDMPLARIMTTNATPPDFVERNDLPDDGEIYEDRLEIDGQMKTITWSRNKPLAPRVLTCTVGNKATLSRSGESLQHGDNRRNVEAVMHRIITADVVDKIITYTNAYASSEIEKKIAAYVPAKDGEKPKRRPTKWKPLDSIEMWAYFGALYYMGAKGLSQRSVDDLFGHDGREAHLELLLAFTRDRFKAITRYLRFYDKVAEEAAKASNNENRRRKFQELLEPIIANCRNLIVPSNTLTVDESLLSFKGRVKWRQYLKNKPDKYGLKFFVLCDSVTGAILDAIAYVGKENDQRETGQCTRVVLDLVRRYAKTGRTIVTDRFYTSPTLACELWKMGLYSVGTVQSNRLGIPTALKDLDLQAIYKPAPKSRKRKSAKQTVNELVESIGSQSAENDDVAKTRSAFIYHGNMTLVKFHPVTAKHKAKKPTMLLSTKHRAPKVSTDDRRKPEIVLNYNEWKFGVDLNDQNVKHVSTKRTSRRWPMRPFYWALDVAAVQAYLVFRMANPETAKDRNFRKRFTTELWSVMMQPHQERQRSAAAKGSIREKNLARLEYALRKFQRKPDTDRFRTMSQLKTKIATPIKRVPGAAARKRLNFDETTAPAVKKTKAEGTCHAPVCKTARRNAYVRCIKCDRPVCPKHRYQEDESKKEYRCADSISALCNGHI